MQKKYVLIDFWFSYCFPCIVEMPKYVAIYNKYKEKNFDVIGISVDREKDLDNWLQKINNLQMSWRNYWDEKSTFTKKMNISKYPTNILINSKGEIVYKNISASELDDFLSEKLKQK